MGSMIGPITLTVGQPYKVQLAQDTAYIELQNDSLYDVWVFFGSVAPIDLTNANNTWHRVVRRQHNGVLPVEGYKGASAAERRNNTIGAFKGVVWLLAVNPGGLALTGTNSGRSQVYLTPYAQGDGLPAHSSLSTQTDLTSQPRIVTVSMATSFTFTGIWQTTDPNPMRLGLFGLSAAQQAALSVPCYLYYANLTPETAGAAGSFDVTIDFQPLDAGSANLGPGLNMARGAVQYTGAGAGVYGPWVCAPAFPMGNLATTGLPVGTALIALQLHSPAGTRANLNFTIAAAVDPSNTVYNAEIGVQPYLSAAGFGGSGVLF